MKLEILEKNHIYHVYNRGINSTSIFLSDENKSYFLKLFSKYLMEKVEIYAYCLMDNHFHIVIKIVDDEKEVTQSLSNLFNAYAKAFNKQNERTGSLFEKHFKRIKIQNENYLRNIIQYVHLNPKYHLGLDYKTYKYSSFQSIISDKQTKLARNEVVSYFHDIDNFIYCHDFKNDELSEKFTLE
jgi:putative transposase